MIGILRTGCRLCGMTSRSIDGAVAVRHTGDARLYGRHPYPKKRQHERVVAFFKEFENLLINFDEIVKSPNLKR